MVWYDTEEASWVNPCNAFRCTKVSYFLYHREGDPSSSVK